TNEDDDGAPLAAAGAGNRGWYYVVTTAGATDIDGVSAWTAGDWIANPDGDAWRKVAQPEFGGAKFTVPPSAPYFAAANGGLKISRFLSNPAAWAVQTAEMQAALDYLASHAQYAGLDLEGRLITLDGPLICDTTPSGSTYPKWISNGALFAAVSASWADATPMLTVKRTDASQLTNFYLEDVVLFCNGRCSGLYVEGNATGVYQTIPAVNVLIWQPQAFGVKTSAAGGNLKCVNVDVMRYDATTAFAARQTIGFDIPSNDAILIGCTAQYCRSAVKMGGGSLTATACHFWQGMNVGAAAPDFSTYSGLLVLKAGYAYTFTDCYLDNSPIEVDFENAVYTMKHLAIRGGRLTTVSGKDDYRFFRFVNLPGAVKVSISIDSHFASYQAVAPTGIF
ncbi:MAG: hypothetical protein KDJ16_14075, partial [Hyphomicrobiales bacterium]|nr:hypothetical protein [Hyphomicrobiales bacterium]